MLSRHSDGNNNLVNLAQRAERYNVVMLITIKLSYALNLDM